MSCEDYTKFNNVTSLNSNHLINQLEENIKTFFDWGFLNIGGFVNVVSPTTGLFGGTFSQLQPSNQPGYNNGQIWQTPRKDWIWESGVNFNNTSPKSISGITIGTTFYPSPTGSGSVAYSINYPLGQVIFNKSQAANAQIKLDYSYRWCQIYKSSSDPYWTELQSSSFEPTPAINQPNKGDYNLSSNHRIQMPCVIIEPIARSFSKPWQLGATDFAVDQDILLHVFAENATDKNKIIDVIRLQKEKTIWLYDINKVVNNSVNPLDYKGSINPSGKTYPYLVSDETYRWHKCYFKEVSLMDMETVNKNLYWCTIRLTTEVII